MAFSKECSNLHLLELFQLFGREILLPPSGPDDKHGLQACGRIGKRVTELAKVIKAGYAALPEGATAWPAGPYGDIVDGGWLDNRDD